MAKKVEWILSVNTRTGIASLNKFKASQEDVTKAMKRQTTGAKRLGTQFRSLKNMIVLVAGAAGLGMLVRSFIKAADTAEQYGVRLKVMLGSQKEGNRLFQEMADYASKVPFQYEQIMGAATQLAGVMKGGVDEVKKWMPLIGDLAATTGLSIEQTTGQVIRMYSAGAAAADMFRERGVLAMMGFRAGVSYSAEETRKKMFEAWNKADSQFKGATKELATTWSGLTSMMSDKWFKFRTMVMDSGPFQALKASIMTINEELDAAFDSGKVEEFAEAVGKTLVNAIMGAALAVFPLIDRIIFVVKNLEEFNRKYDVINRLNQITGGVNVAKMSTILSGWGAIGRSLFGVKRGSMVESVFGEMGEEDRKFENLINKIQSNYEKFLDDIDKKEKEKERPKIVTPMALGFAEPSWIVGATPKGITAQTDAIAKMRKEERQGFEQYMQDEIQAYQLHQQAMMAAYGSLVEKRQFALDMELEAVKTKYQKEIELMEKYGIDATEFIEAKKAEIREHYRQEDLERERQKQEAMLDLVQTQAGEFASLYREMAQAGLIGQKKGFAAYKAFATIEAMIASYSAFTKALASPLPPIVREAYAASILAMGFAKVALIQAQQPPSYDTGGVSTKPELYYAGVPEAHIPLKSGSVPVTFQGGSSRNVYITLNNPVFQDLDTQYQVMNMIAETVARKVAPDAVVQNYLNDGRTRTVIRSRR